MEENKLRLPKFIYLPIIFFIAITPLVIRGVFVEYTAVDIFWLSSEKMRYDFANFYKMRFILYTGVFAVVSYIYLLFTEKAKLKKDPINFILLGLSFFVIISAILSEYGEVASLGYFTRYENTYVYLSYLFMAFYTKEVLRTKKEFNLVIYSFLASTFIFSTIGILQYFSKDPLRQGFLGNLLIPKEMADTATIEDLNFRFPEGRSFATLFNPNYVGTYVSVAVMFFISFLFESKNYLKRILIIIASGLLVFTLIGASSRAGLIALGVTGVFFVLVNLPIIRKDVKKISVIALVIILAFAALQTERGIQYKDKLMAGLDFEQRELPELKGYETKEETIEMTLGDEVYTFRMQHEEINSVALYDGEEQIDMYFDGDIYYFKDPRFEDISIKYGRVGKNNTNESYVQISYGNIKYNFALLNNGVHYLYQNKVLGTMSTADYIESWEGYGREGSGRIFIWSRSIPVILNNYLFVGAGADVYPMVYPQDDYIAKRFDFTNETIIVDKPHNLYILYATNFGMIFLLLFLAMNAYLIYQLIISKKESDWYRYLTNSVILGMIAYLAVGMINDSTVGTAPVYWIILGMGMALIKKSEENKKPKFMKK